MIRLDEILGKKIDVDKVKDNSFDCLGLSEKLANELFKSTLSDKIKIIAIDLCVGSLGNKEKKFSLTITGKIGADDQDECSYIKERFVEIGEDFLGNKDSAISLIDYFWDVKYKQKLEIGSKFESIEGSFNRYGNKERIEHEEGRVLIIDVWATWCGYCIEPMNKNLKIIKELEKEDFSNVDFVAISCDKDSDQNNWINFIRTNKWNDLHHLRNKEIMKVFEINTIPFILIVDTKGNIAYSGHPNEIKDLKQTLINYSTNANTSTNSTGKGVNSTVENMLKREDPNPQWTENSKIGQEDIVNTVNEMIAEKGINSVQFIVSTKILYYNGKRIVHSQPIFSGCVFENQFEGIQEIGLFVSDGIGLKDVQYNIKLLAFGNSGNLTNSIKSVFENQK